MRYLSGGATLIESHPAEHLFGRVGHGNTTSGGARVAAA